MYAPLFDTYFTVQRSSGAPSGGGHSEPRVKQSLDLLALYSKFRVGQFDDDQKHVTEVGTTL